MRNRGFSAVAGPHGGHHGGHGHHGGGRGRHGGGLPWGYPAYWGGGYDYPSSEIFLVEDSPEEKALKLAQAQLLLELAKKRSGLKGLGATPAELVAQAKAIKAKAQSAIKSNLAKATQKNLQENYWFGYPKKTVLLLGGGVLGVAALLLLNKKMKKSKGTVSAAAPIKLPTLKPGKV